MQPDGGNAEVPWRGSVFATTHWSVVLAACGQKTSESAAALEELCRAYWSPVHAYLRRWGHTPEDAQDLTQGFFERVIQGESFCGVDPRKGRFRTFLLTALKHFLCDQRDRQRALKRGGGRPEISLDALAAHERGRVEPIDALSADKLYQRQWALAVLEHAFHRLREDFVASGKGAIFEALKGVVVGEKGSETYTELGARFGRSESAVRNTVQRVRQRYRDYIREEIAKTVPCVTEVDEEIRFLMEALSAPQRESF